MFGRDALRGIIPPLATPLTPAEDVDRAGMGRLVEYVLAGGSHGVFVLGGTGEFAFLDERQRAAAIEAAVEAVNGRVPVIAGVSAVGTRQAIAHARRAQAAGADFIIATVPYFGSSALDQSWIEAHVRAIAEATGAQTMLYNVPPLLRDIEPTTIERLAALPGVVGMKDSASIIHVQDVLFRTRQTGFRVLVGMEYHVVAALLVGAHGATPSPANLIPGRYVEMYERAQASDRDGALAIQEETNRFVDVFDALPVWNAAVKTALHLMGICGPTTAAPVPKSTPDEVEQIRAHLARAGMLS
ncbi:MAG: dihydrodipicolinate synthase family protein [Chloroflexi bacterium]|nr:dihydrodipicolinate synthase family protein [Chloroflexota bacterium]